jgi:hypothetical protein
MDIVEKVEIINLCSKLTEENLKYVKAVVNALRFTEIVLEKHAS